MFGPEHPDTFISAWNLFRTLQNLGQGEAARVTLNPDPLWLLDRDPGALSADQRKLRDYAGRAAKDYLPRRKEVSFGRGTPGAPWSAVPGAPYFIKGKI